MGLDAEGRLAVAIDPRIHAQQHSRARSALRIMAAAAAHLPRGTVRGSSSELAQLPHAHGLVAFNAGHVDAARAELLLERMGAVPRVVLDRASAGRISLLQDDSLLPTAETRAARVVLEPRAEGLPPSALDERIDRIATAAGPAWADFLAVVRIVTFVAVEGRPHLPYFSGASSDFWGGVHLSHSASAAVLAEGLTHEAAHLWLMLAEEVEPLCEGAWDGNAWNSPWRDDPRPLGGIVHGVFVFSCAALVLATLVRAGVAGPETRERIARITAQVEVGAQECRRSQMLAPLGSAVVEGALGRIASARQVVSAPELEAALRCVEAEHESKRSSRAAALGSPPHG